MDPMRKGLAQSARVLAEYCQKLEVVEPSYTRSRDISADPRASRRGRDINIVQLIGGGGPWPRCKYGHFDSYDYMTSKIYPGACKISFWVIEVVSSGLSFNRDDDQNTRGRCGRVFGTNSNFNQRYVLH